MTSLATDRTPVLAEDVVRAVSDLLVRPSLDSEELPEALQAVEGMADLHRLLIQLRHMAFALSKGDLQYACREKGFVIGTLKSLQSDLRHLTWQVQCVAKGEYQHRAHFMGDFSESFNMMVEELDKSVTSLKCRSQKYKELSGKDPLTGLFNRRAFMALALKTLQYTVDRHTPVSLIMVDVDFFKKINDTYGHACGDAVLRHIADTLSAQLRSKDILGRYGGEEFLLLLPESGLQNSIATAERLRQAVEHMEVATDSLKIHVTASFGVSELNSQTTDENLQGILEECIKSADHCMYQAKQMGRNRVFPPLQNGCQERERERERERESSYKTS